MTARGKPNYLDISGWPRVTSVLRAVGLGGDFSRIDPDVMEAARTRGTAVHAYAEARHYGYDFDLDPQYKSWAEAYDRFVSETQHVPIVSEYAVHHPQWRYRGTLDRVGWHGAERWLIDVKSGSSTGADFQLAAYAYAWGAMRPQEPIARAAVVELRGDGTYRINRVEDLAGATRVWLAALTVYGAQR